MKAVTFQEWLRQYVQLMEKVRDGKEIDDWTLPEISGG